MSKFVPRVFSGMQPTGNLHLGNYLGAIRRFVALQESHECIYCVVDMHAITMPTDVWGGPAELARSTREVTAALIAAGIDPKAVGGGLGDPRADGRALGGGCDVGESSRAG